MANFKVRVGGIYIYHPNLLDRVDGRTDLESGDLVRVVNLPGCPKANVMNHCHVADPETGKFIGLVHTNSLHTNSEYIAYLRNRLAAHADNPTNKNAIASPLHTAAELEA